MPTSRDEAAGRWDLVGIAASIATITLLVWTVIEAPKAGWGSLQTVGGFVLVAALLAAFVRHEARVEHPMLDVTVFRNARFSAASLAVATAFFGLFGFIFLVTQYFQVVRGYDTLSAGVHTLPFAITAAIISPISARLALRFGTKRIVGLGLASMSVGFFWASFLTADTSYWAVIVPQMIFMAGGLALTTAPATESIMGSLPKAKAGVGSAVNDTTREIGGTLGVAVVGSAFSSLYGPQIVDKLTALGVPAEPVRIAEESVVAAVEVANRAPRSPAPPSSKQPRTPSSTAWPSGAGWRRWPRWSARPSPSPPCPPERRRPPTRSRADRWASTPWPRPDPGVDGAGWPRPPPDG
ncbi:MAG: MFS transporter [Acidimicrobiales bacterium]